jgi:glutamate--cysteine ligase catalytic subunit
MRKFIRSHPDYKFDSVINERINYDLLKAVDEMYVKSACVCQRYSESFIRERGVRTVPDLLPQDEPVLPNGL